MRFALFPSFRLKRGVLSRTSQRLWDSHIQITLPWGPVQETRFFPSFRLERGGLSRTPQRSRLWVRILKRTLYTRFALFSSLRSGKEQPMRRPLNAKGGSWKKTVQKLRPSTRQEPPMRRLLERRQKQCNPVTILSTRLPIFQRLSGVGAKF